MHRLDSPASRDAFGPIAIFNVFTAGDPAARSRAYDRDAFFGSHVRSALTARRKARIDERIAQVNASSPRQISTAPSAR